MQDSILENQYKHAVRVNKDNLLQLVNDNKDTVFGKKHGFSSIDSIDEFRKKVP